MTKQELLESIKLGSWVGPAYERGHEVLMNGQSVYQSKARGLEEKERDCALFAAQLRAFILLLGPDPTVAEMPEEKKESSYGEQMAGR